LGKAERSKREKESVVQPSHRPSSRISKSLYVSRSTKTSCAPFWKERERLVERESGPGVAGGRGVVSLREEEREGNGGGDGGLRARM
jgi:hypothetical protein